MSTTKVSCLTAFVAAGLLASCASVSTGPEVIVAEGRITIAKAVEGQLAPTPAAYEGGRGGAVGAGVLYLVRYSMGSKSHTRYIILQPDGNTKSVATTENFQNGTCVAAFGPQTKQSSMVFELGEARLQLSTNCAAEEKSQN